MIAIVTAGGASQPGEPLYKLTQGGLKAMLKIGNKPMVQWVLDALSQTNRISHVIVVGLPPETDLDCSHPMWLLPDEGDMINNIRAGAKQALKLDSSALQALLVSGDIPGISPEIINWMLDQVTEPEYDLYYSVIERSTMEAGFPLSRRTYIHLKDSQVCGGDMHCFRLLAAVEEGTLWKKLIDSRKSPIRQASLLGFDTLFFLMLRQLRLQDAETMVCKRLGIKGKAILSPYPEVGMDIDKPFQFDIMQEFLSQVHEKKSSRSA